VSEAKMRTQTEIVTRINERKGNGFLGFETGEYIAYLDFEHAKPFLKDGVTVDEWAAPELITADLGKIKERMIDYMDFAWEKAKNCRGISASRSISHYQAWLWLEGVWSNEDIDALANYQHYGKDELAKICTHLGLDASKYDDNIRKNHE